MNPPTTYSLVGPISLDRIPPATLILARARLLARRPRKAR